MAQAAAKIEKGEWLSKAAIAKRCGIHVQTLTSRLDDLGFVADEERSSAKNQVYWFDDEIAFAIKSAKDSLAAAKIRDLRATYELKELKLAEARGELVSWIDAVERMQAIFGRLYKEFAIQQPKRLATRLARAKTVSEINKLLKLDTEKVFGRLRESDAEFVGKVG